jgi:hypothetical protein
MKALKTPFCRHGRMSAGRAGGAITAAMFLKKLSRASYRWAHLDIAGTAWKSGPAKGCDGAAGAAAHAFRVEPFTLRTEASRRGGPAMRPRFTRASA